MKHSSTSLSFRGFYGSVLFVVCLCTLEELYHIGTDVFKLPENVFHALTVIGALIVASLEASTLGALEWLKSYFVRPDPFAETAPEGDYQFRRAYREEVLQIHQLAKDMYGRGYRFSEEGLREWWRCNDHCFFVLVYNGSVMGYVDAFPISETDYQHLLAGKD